MENSLYNSLDFIVKLTWKSKDGKVLLSNKLKYAVVTMKRNQVTIEVYSIDFDLLNNLVGKESFLGQNYIEVEAISTWSKIENKREVKHKNVKIKIHKSTLLDYYVDFDESKLTLKLDVANVICDNEDIYDDLKTLKTKNNIVFEVSDFDSED